MSVRLPRAAALTPPIRVQGQPGLGHLAAPGATRKVGADANTSPNVGAGRGAPRLRVAVGAWRAWRRPIRLAVADRAPRRSATPPSPLHRTRPARPAASRRYRANGDIAGRTAKRRGGRRAGRAGDADGGEEDWSHEGRSRTPRTRSRGRSRPRPRPAARRC